MISQMTQSARWLCLAAFAMLLNSGWLSAICWAASAAPEEPPEKTYVPVYIIIIMAVVLGLTAICRMGKRSFDVKRPTK